ncbi:MAG: 1,4-dihydroxy-2-naphthoate polyprenyltransferase [Myxococcales bacterium]|nr:1,4-dihydroxy-2-naphthoate polyprenyltransferase [Myxococcales bacterium]
MSATAIAPGSARAWLLASRPATLSAAVVPVSIGSAVAHALHGFALWPALAALFGAIWIQIGTNFANDVYDYKKGADTGERVGPTRAAQAGLLTPRQLFTGMFVAFGVAALCGLYLLLQSGWPIAVIGVASILSGIAYTGGPYPLGYNGLGDLFVMVFFGFVAVCGTVFVQIAVVPELAIWASIPVGALATAILVVNNIRDTDTDVLCGKRTLAVRFGRSAARLEFVVLIGSAFVVPTALVLRQELGALALLIWLSAPLAALLVKQVSSSTDSDVLNGCLKRSAILLLVHGILFTLGIIL